MKLARKFVDEFPMRNACVGHFFVKNPGVYSGGVQQIVKNGKGPSSASIFRRVQWRHLVERIYTAFALVVVEDRRWLSFSIWFTRVAMMHGAQQVYHLGSLRLIPSKMQFSVS